MISKINNKIDILLKFLFISFPIFIILGPFALNSFSLIFSIYAILNYKLLISSKIFDKRILIVFFSFIILIFPFESIDFENSKTPLENTQKISNDDSSKNLANFFNGEIIDLDE